MPPNLYPCTKGLLVSMAIRHSHDYDHPEHIVTPQFVIGHDDTFRKELITEMYGLYLKFTQPDFMPPTNGTESQLFEEVAGLGFYSPEREQWYADRWPKEFTPEFRLAAPQPLPEDKGPHKTQFRCNNCCEEFEAFDFSEHTCTPIGGSD